MKKLLVCLCFLTACACSPEEQKYAGLMEKTKHHVHTLIELRTQYCYSTESDSGKKVLKKLLIRSIRFYQPMYPEDGICTERFDRLVEVLTKP